MNNNILYIKKKDVKKNTFAHHYVNTSNYE